MTLKELIGKIGFQVEHDKLEKVEKQLEGIKHRLEFLGGVELVKGLAEVTEKFVKFGEELHLAANSAGLTVEAFQKLSFSAAQSAVSQEEMERSLARLSRHLNDARHGSAEARKAFAQVGITSQQLEGFKTSRDALLAISDRFKNIKDPIQKAAIAQELLGRNSQRMVGYLNQGSKAIKAQGDEAEKLGLILGEHQVEALVELEHSLQKLWALFKAVGATIAANVAPVFNYMVNDFIKFFGVNRDIVQINFQNWLNNIAFAMGFLWEGAKVLIETLIKLAKYFHMEGDIFPLVASIVSLVLAVHGLLRVWQLAIAFFGPVVKGVLFVVDAMKALQVAVGLANIGFLPFLVVVGSVIFAIHELFAILNGQPTWLDQFVEWAKSLDIVKKGIELLSISWNNVKSDVSGFFDKAASFIGFGGNVEQNVTSKFGVPESAPSSIANNVGGNTTANVNAPITVNVPPGTDPKHVGDKVKEGVREHLDRLMRETGRSTRSPVAI